MGRHGTQRGGGTRRALALTLIPLLLLAAVGGGYLWWTDRPTTAAAAAQGTQPCAAPLQVLVAAELAPVAREVLSAGGADGCTVAEVRSTASAQSAVQAIGTGQVPDVWVPDSSTWLDALPGSGDLPTAPDGWEQGPSVATSPVVLVSPTAGKGAVAAAPTSWSEQVNVSGQVRMANPDTDTASRLAYFASRIDRPEALDLTVAGKLIFASRFAAASTQDQLAGLATTKDPPPFPASEQAAAAHAETAPGTLRTFVPQAGTISLDYPWLVNRALPADRQALAATAVKALQSDAGHAAVAQAGFRTPATTSGPAIDGTRGAAYTELPTPTADDRSGALEQWDILRTDMRMLAILDVSGSMKQPGKGTRGMTRAKVTEEAAVTALQILPAGSRIGAWVFSTDQRGKGVDYKELARVERLDKAYGGGTWRDRLVAVTRTLPKRLGGDTGLYDTTAAAYQKMVAEYDGNYVNSVVIMTDGKNDDPGGGLDLRQLLARIKATSKGDRPVRVITIGMGEADPRALQAISRATGGTSYIANTPADIQRVFVQALLARTAK
jgi:Ca-activated chloride channel homolog